MEAWLEAFMIGDAYGSGFEMRPPEYVAEFNDGLTYREHGLDKTHRPGMTTDDTQMTLALMEAIQHAGNRFTYAEAFCAAYEKSPAPGYGRRMREWMSIALRAESPAETLLWLGRSSVVAGECLYDTCGAAMRAIPCGIESGGDPSAACYLAYEQARVTHHHPDAIDAAVAVAYAACMLPKYVDATVHSEWPLDLAMTSVNWPSARQWRPAMWERGTTRGKDIVQACFGLLLRHDSLHKLLVESVALGGDVDTLAALCLGLGALSPNRWKNDLPQSLRDGLVRP